MHHMSNEICIRLINELSSLHKTYPLVSARIEAKWGTVVGHRYLRSLLVKDRDSRVGFPLDVYTQIMKLFLIHQAKYGNFNEPLEVSNTNLKIE